MNRKEEIERLKLEQQKKRGGVENENGEQDEKGKMRWNEIRGMQRKEK